MEDTRKPETVSALTTRIRGVLETSFAPGVWVEGEISNFKVVTGSGHAYFSLKDAGAQIACAFFRFTMHMPGADIKDGEKVRVRGEVTVYEQRGSYQIAARSIERTGIGDLMVRFEELKRKLKAEGLFDREKRQLPALPRKIGIVTSPTGAAIRDMLNVTRRRFANIHIVLAPALVQGVGAAKQIVAGIELLNNMPAPPDVIIVGRGGGSIEDLWSFNEEEVARAIHASGIPVISAVGHETDVTIADWVADVRAPTPSAAAELVVGRKEDFEKRFSTMQTRLVNAVWNAVRHARSRIEISSGSHVFRKPETLVRQHSQRIDNLWQRMESALKGGASERRTRLAAATPRMAAAIGRSLNALRLRLSELGGDVTHGAETALAERGHKLETLSARLETLNPAAVLSRGYAIVKGEDCVIIKSAAQARAGDKVVTQLRDGEFSSLVLDGTASSAKRKAMRRPKPASAPSPEQQTLF